MRQILSSVIGSLNLSCWCRSSRCQARGPVLQPTGFWLAWLLHERCSEGCSSANGTRYNCRYAFNLFSVLFWYYEHCIP
jgi:hypothetical protein